MKEFVVSQKLSVQEVNYVAEKVKKGGYDMIRSYDQIEIDFSGLQMLFLLNKTYHIQIEIEVVASSVEILSKVGFKSIFDECCLRLK